MKVDGTRREGGGFSCLKINAKPTPSADEPRALLAALVRIGETLSLVWEHGPGVFG